MGKLFVLMLSCTLAMVCDISWAAQDISAIVQKSLPGVVVVYAQNNAQDACQGSGFFVTKNGDVITNFHVLQGMQTFAIKANDGQIYPAQVRAFDQVRDIALLATRVPASKYTVIPFAPQIPPIGTSVFALGSPKGLEKSVSDGLVSQVRKFGDTQYLQISCPVSPGSSGGPVLNNKGEAVGMATLNLEGGQNLNFAIPAPTLKNFVEYAKNLDPISLSPQQPRAPKSSPPPASAPRPTLSKERYVHVSNVDGMKSYIDTYSIKQDGGFVRFWIVTKLNNATSKGLAKLMNIKKGTPATLSGEYEIDFFNRQMRVVRVELLGQKGEVLNKETINPSWETLNPGTPGAAWYDYILKNYYQE